MKSFTYQITDSSGMHARPAGMFVKEASKFNSDIQVSSNGKSADGKKLFALMALNIKCGQFITISTLGTDELEAANAMEAFLQNNL